MTQPVQEPNPNRDISGLGWGERQLARRPAPPSGACPCPVDWAVANGDSDTIVDNNTVSSIPYASVDIAPGSTCFQAGGITKPIDIVQAGWYLFYLEAWPGGIGALYAGDYGIGIQKSGGVMYNASYSAGGVYTRDVSYTKRPAFQTGYFKTFGPFFCASTPVHIGGIVYHSLDTPGTQDWNYGVLTAIYLGPGIGLDNSTYPNGVSGDERYRTYF